MIFIVKFLLYIPDLADPFLLKRFTEIIEKGSELKSTEDF